jgi:hypothetical protein
MPVSLGARKEFFLSHYVLTFSGRSTRIYALKGEVEVAKVHMFVHSGI